MAPETRGQALGGRLCISGEGEGRAGTAAGAPKWRSQKVAVTCLTFPPSPQTPPLPLILGPPQLWRLMGAKQLKGTNEHNRKMLELTNNHGNGRMTVRSSGNVLNKEKMWSEDTFSSNWRAECHT